MESAPDFTSRFLKQFGVHNSVRWNHRADRLLTFMAEGFYHDRYDVKSQLQGRKNPTITCSLPETAASVAVTATLVGCAVTLLVKRTKPSETKEIQFRAFEDCAGSGICSECNGEGFVLKKLSEENAERARKLSKNMATRFTAGLPKKWSYCTKCSSGRSCPTCGGSGKLSI